MNDLRDLSERIQQALDEGKPLTLDLVESTSSPCNLPILRSAFPDMATSLTDALSAFVES